MMVMLMTNRYGRRRGLSLHLRLNLRKRKFVRVMKESKGLEGMWDAGGWSEEKRGAGNEGRSQKGKWGPGQ